MTRKLDMKAEARAVAELCDALWIREDDMALVAETETNFNEAVGQVLHAIDDDEALLTGIAFAMNRLKDRAERLKHRVDQRKAAILSAMQTAGLSKLELPEATISARKPGVPSVVITDETAIPSDLMRETVRLNPDKTAIKEKLAKGEEVPGAVLSNPRPTLSIRRG